MNVDPLEAMFSPPWLHQTAHVLLSCYAAVSFAMAGIHAWVLLRYGREPASPPALGIALGVACVAALLQPLSGDFSAKHVARAAAAQAGRRWRRTSTRVRARPLHLGGLPDVETARCRTRWSCPAGCPSSPSVSRTRR